MKLEKIKQISLLSVLTILSITCLYNAWKAPLSAYITKKDSV